MDMPASLYATAAAFASATLHEAGGGIGALPSALKPIDPNRKLCGRALTVDSPPGDNLWIHRALLAARPGEILVCAVSGAYEHGYWGEILTVAAMARGIAGLVIDGGVRDADQMQALGFPVFSRGLCIRGTDKRLAGHGAIGEPVVIGEVTIASGDLVLGDRDGVVAIPAHRIEAVLDAAAERERKEEAIMRRLRDGEDSLTIYGWTGAPM